MEGTKVTKVADRWQEIANLVLGIWLFVSPWVLQYAGEPNAAWNAYVVGAAIALLAAVGTYIQQTWDDICTLGLGIWMVAAPYAWGFASHSAATLNAVVVGVLVAVLAAWTLVREVDLAKRSHDRQTT